MVHKSAGQCATVCVIKVSLRHFGEEKHVDLNVLTAETGRKWYKKL